MNNFFKIIFVGIVILAVLKQDEMNKCFEGDLVQLNHVPIANKHEQRTLASVQLNERNYFVNDTIYRWNDHLFDWEMVNNRAHADDDLQGSLDATYVSTQPIKVEWETLMNIQYRLKYFSEIDLEMYAPCFPKAVKALHKKEIIIEGFIIPFDEEEELLSLSFNPYASCFFCGKASPASVMSMYLKNKRKRYKVDDFKTFSGILHLNYDDPNEFYYILKEAKEI